jgi:hypothetical protein
MLVDVGSQANEKHSRNVCENLQHMVPINEVVAGAWQQAPKLFKLPRSYQLV